uniref:EOG090X01LU n=1 Tax=Alona affinis TaxID=381656 RepID=A0A9N6WRR8_9CRUS|nr:EOG090X01LU [Alona affinis]
MVQEETHLSFGQLSHWYRNKLQEEFLLSLMESLGHQKPNPVQAQIACALIEELGDHQYNFAYTISLAHDDKSLRLTAVLRPYKQNSLLKIFRNDRARSGLIIIPGGAVNCLVRVKACYTVRKRALVLCNSAVSEEQWKRQFNMWSTARDRRTRRSNNFISKNGTYYGLIVVLDEMQGFPAEMVRRIFTNVQDECRLGLAAILVREDEKITDLHLLVGPKLYEADLFEVQKSGFVPVLFMRESSARAHKSRVLSGVLHLTSGNIDGVHKSRKINNSGSFCPYEHCYRAHLLCKTSDTAMRAVEASKIQKLKLFVEGIVEEDAMQVIKELNGKAELKSKKFRVQFSICTSNKGVERKYEDDDEDPIPKKNPERQEQIRLVLERWSMLFHGVVLLRTNFDSCEFGVKVVLQSEELWTVAIGNEIKLQPILNNRGQTCNANAAAISASEKKISSTVRIIYSSVKKKKGKKNKEKTGTEKEEGMTNMTFTTTTDAKTAGMMTETDVRMTIVTRRMVTDAAEATVTKSCHHRETTKRSKMVKINEMSSPADYEEDPFDSGSSDEVVAKAEQQIETNGDRGGGKDMFGAKDYRDLQRKPDHAPTPLLAIKHTVLGTFSTAYKEAQDFLNAISETVTRKKLTHEYKLTTSVLSAAASIGLQTHHIIEDLERLSKTEIQEEIEELIRTSTVSYGKNLYKNEYDDEDTSPFEMNQKKIDSIQKRCIDLECPLLIKNDFRHDNYNPDITIDFKPTAVLRLYQHKSLFQIFHNDHARSGFIIIPGGDSNSLFGVAACCTIRKCALERKAEIIVFCYNVFALEHYAKAMEKPFIRGEMEHDKRLQA